VPHAAQVHTRQFDVAHQTPRPVLSVPVAPAIPIVAAVTHQNYKRPSPQKGENASIKTSPRKKPIVNPNIVELPIGHYATDNTDDDTDW
jgi:hypothetical protein